MATGCCSSARPTRCASCIRRATATSPRCGKSCAGARCSTRGANSLLRALEIRDFVLVERASLELEAGFSVLTGETGAGKSILVAAIELLVGARAGAGVGPEGG